ncbi:hypothetical protein LRS13_21300 [Svornostia abyssi]|uniref:Uncharacterized protein n=1 Tax=Svornostia abyssi TaxID=2898438 RepID=A0ABY5PES2_9ACTN|nr:hypothetical protein LRS13_21300 [Parviterribacteraceae bacterium J379]
MLYRLMGRGHAAMLRMRDETGQGTIEYVGLMVLMATVLTGLVTVAKPAGNDLPKTIVAEIKQQIQAVGGE